MREDLADDLAAGGLDDQAQQVKIEDMYDFIKISADKFDFILKKLESLQSRMAVLEKRSEHLMRKINKTSTPSPRPSPPPTVAAAKKKKKTHAPGRLKIGHGYKSHPAP